MDKSEKQFQRMTSAPIPVLITSLAVPTVISMLVTAVYNTADTYFVSKLGKSASGAVGVVFSLMAVIQAVGFTLGMGSGSWISRLLGQKKYNEAIEISASAFYSSIVFGILLAIGGSVFIDPIMKLLGATESILPYARAYGRYILFAAPVMAASFVLNNLLRAEGKARFSMIGIASGGVLNIFLDPLFIYTFELGTAGAAIATAISQCISFLILLYPFLNGKTVTKLNIKYISKKAGIYIYIIKYGLPSLCRQGLASIATIALNVNASVYGDAAIAAMAIVSKIFMLVFSAIIGFGQGYQPVVGYNFGAGRYKRVREAFFFTLKVGMSIMFIFSIIGYINAPSLIMAFIKDDAQVIDIGTKALRAQCIVMPLVPFGVVCNMTFQSIGKAWTATFLSVARQGIFFLPLILVLPMFMGLTGVQATQPLADVLTFLCGIPFAVHFFRTLDTAAAMHERQE
ncbi:MAG: MATE family efflux transporter [Clostridiaceae bacterium]